MEQQEEASQVTVQVDKGMEPTILMIIAEENTALSHDHDLLFKVIRNKTVNSLLCLSLMPTFTGNSFMEKWSNKR